MVIKDVDQPRTYSHSIYLSHSICDEIIHMANMVMEVIIGEVQQAKYFNVFSDLRKTGNLLNMVRISSEV